MSAIWRGEETFQRQGGTYKNNGNKAEKRTHRRVIIDHNNLVQWY